MWLCYGSVPRNRLFIMFGYKVTDLHLVCSEMQCRFKFLCVRYIIRFFWAEHNAQLLVINRYSTVHALLNSILMNYWSHVGCFVRVQGKSTRVSCLRTIVGEIPGTLTLPSWFCSEPSVHVHVYTHKHTITQ